MSDQKLFRLLFAFAGAVGVLVIGFFAIVAFAPWDTGRRESIISAPLLTVRDDDKALGLARAAMQELGKNPAEFRLGEFAEGRFCGRNENDPDFAHILFISTNRPEGWSVRLEQRGSNIHCSISPTK